MRLPKIGKISRDVFDEVIYPHLGVERRDVILKPQHGVDAGVFEVGDKVIVVAEDPTFGMPSLLPYFGWAIVHICASDVAVLGVPPMYMTISLLFPPETDPGLFRRIWLQIHDECRRLGISIIGGHTGVYPGISYPLNGGCTVIGIGKRGDLRPSSNARPGDRLIVTKGAAIEAAAILAVQAEEELRDRLGKEVVDKAKGLIYEMSVVEDALTAAPYCHAMHDATEGGLINGVLEVAYASGLGVEIYEEKIIIRPEVKAITDYFKIDPLTAISEGTLIIAASEDNCGKILSELKVKGIEASIIGEFTREKSYRFIRADGSVDQLRPVKVDPFWEAYFSTLK